MSKLPVDVALKVARDLAHAIPVVGVKFAFGDFNFNGSADVTLEVHLKGGNKVVLGPIDVGPNPGSLLEDAVDFAEKALGA